MNMLTMRWPEHFGSTQARPRRGKVTELKARTRFVAGLDGCRGGWLCLCRNLATGQVSASIIPSIESLLAVKPRPLMAMVDIPIGLMDAGARECDVRARAVLKAPRASSVFPPPVRAMLTARTYTEACNLGHQAHGRKLSKQCWGIVPKICEVDRFLCEDTSRQQWVREVHPEVCFWAWNQQRAMLHPKKTPEGKAEREALVNGVYAEEYAKAQAHLTRCGPAHENDDLLDAFAALWSAERAVAGSATTFPAAPPLDSCGLRMEMVV